MTRSSATGRFDALVFDFDGTIIDTETSGYESWRDTFIKAGVEPISFEVWLAHLGRADGDGFDIRAELCRRLGVDGIPPELEGFRRRRRDQALLDQDLTPIRAGVMDWIRAAGEYGLALAIASSSGSGWVTGHLDRLDLAGFFATVSCADPPTPGKPDPAVYLNACAGVGVDPARALAIEDSPTGAQAARAAGLTCIVAPGPVTATVKFGPVDLEVSSLADADPSRWLRA